MNRNKTFFGLIVLSLTMPVAFGAQVNVEKALVALTAIESSALSAPDQATFKEAKELLKDALESLNKDQREFTIKRVYSIQLLGSWHGKDWIEAAANSANHAASVEMNKTCGLNRYGKVNEISRYNKIDGTPELGPWSKSNPRSYIRTGDLYATVPVLVDLAYRCSR